jgi:hypothetical protein
MQFQEIAMNDKASDQIKDLSNRVGNLESRVSAVEKSQAINFDLIEALSNIQSYTIEVDDRFYRMGIAAQAVNLKFTEFLATKEKPSTFWAYWDAAWSVISTILPVLRMSETFRKVEQKVVEEVKIIQDVEEATLLAGSQLVSGLSKSQPYTSALNSANTARGKVMSAIDASKKKQPTGAIPLDHPRSCRQI